MSDEPIDPLALESQVCFALAVASRSVISLYRPILEPMGLTHPQYLVMLALWQQEPRSVSALASALRLEPATLSPLLKRLEAQGYVTRRRSAADERQLEVGLTEAGRALRAQAERIPPTIMGVLDMDTDELLALHADLTALIARADAATTSSAP